MQIFSRFSNSQTFGNLGYSQMVQMLALPEGEEEKFIVAKAAEVTIKERFMEKYYLATLKSVGGIGNKTVRQLVEFFGSAENVWCADLAELQQAGLNKKTLDNFINFRRNFPDAVEKLIKFCEVNKVKMVGYYSENYPPILKDIADAPTVFYYRGELKPNAERISVIGSRDATPYGEKVTRNLAAELSAAGFTIVSGAARGIDTFAHKAAARCGRTVAVLGYGFNKIPADSFQLLDEIISSGGVVMTEFPPNYEGNKFSFPARDRIIAGLSSGVVVVESAEKSGTMITAGYAKSFSRKIFVIPHNVFSDKGVGCNNLISEGATLITCAQDVLKKL